MTDQEIDNKVLDTEKFYFNIKNETTDIKISSTVKILKTVVVGDTAHTCMYNASTKKVGDNRYFTSATILEQQITKDKLPKLIETGKYTEMSVDEERQSYGHFMAVIYHMNELQEQVQEITEIDENK